MFDLFGFGFANVDPTRTPVVDDAARAADDDEQAVADEINDVMVNVMPWLATLALHVSVVMLAIFTVWVLTDEVEQDRNNFAADVRFGPTPGRPLVVQDVREKREPSDSRRSDSRKIRPTNSVIDLPIEFPTSEIGPSGGPADRNPFGKRFKNGPGPVSDGPFSPGGAPSAVFVIDASGSLFDTMPFVIAELKGAIGKLGPEQTFTVIFFQDGEVIEPAICRGMKPATAEVKMKVIEWIDLGSGNVSPRGRTDPRGAIERALSYKPALVILLSDNIIGKGKDAIPPEQLLATAAKADPKTKINTIQFIYPDPLIQFGGDPTLKRVSDMTGGKYRFVSESDLHSR